MRIASHPKSIALFCLVALAFVSTGLLLGGGSFRSESRARNTDQRSVLVEMLLVEQAQDGSDPALADLLAVARPEGGARMLTPSEFDTARTIASTLSSPWVRRTPTLVSQHNETSSTTVSLAGGASSARVSVTPSVLDDDVLRVALSIGQSAGGVESAVEMAFTSRGGAAMACETFATERGGDGRANGSTVLLIRPTLVVDKP
jgi:hypothetical protein